MMIHAKATDAIQTTTAPTRPMGPWSEQYWTAKRPVAMDAPQAWPNQVNAQAVARAVFLLPLNSVSSPHF